ncbi:MAG: copper transporter, partial [Nocardioidaceae bacterium]
MRRYLFTFVAVAVALAVGVAVGNGPLQEDSSDDSVSVAKQNAELDDQVEGLQQGQV